MTTPLRLAVIIGSTREGRFGPVPAAWIAERARRHGGYDVDVVDLADSDLPRNLGGFGESPHPHDHVRTLSERLDRADAFVVVTPEYNHSFPAPLKAAIDYFQLEWHAKPIGFVSYGGVAGGQRAVEQLRQVFCETHSMTVRNTIAFARYWELFDDNGEPFDSHSADSAATTMLDQIAWWGSVLRTARADTPYGW